MIAAETAWWSDLDTTGQIFWGIAIVFSVLFIIQFGLSLFGLDLDADADVEMGSSGAEYSIDPSFALLSVRSIIAFFTFFGWAGVLALASGYNTSLVLIIAGLTGFAAMAMVAYMMYFFSRLAETGNADLNELIYKNGTVYLSIPARRKGKGKVHVTLGNSLRELDAVTEGELLPQGQEVKIIEILEDDILVVESVEIFETNVS